MEIRKDGSSISQYILPSRPSFLCAFPVTRLFKRSNDVRDKCLRIISLDAIRDNVKRNHIRIALSLAWNSISTHNHRENAKSLYKEIGKRAITTIFLTIFFPAQLTRNFPKNYNRQLRLRIPSRY